MNLVPRFASITACAAILAMGHVVSAQGIDRNPLHAEVREKLRKAQEAFAKDDLHSSKKLHLEALEIRKKLFPASEYPDGTRDLWESYAAVAKVLLDLDPVAGEAYCREALRQRPTPTWRRGENYASTLILWGQYLGRLHPGSFAEEPMLAGLRIYEEHGSNDFSPYLSLCEHYLDRGDRDGPARQALMLFVKSAPMITLRMENHLNHRVHMSWIGSLGNRNPSGSLEPKQRQERKVRAGSTWILTDDNGAIVGAADTDKNSARLLAHDVWPPHNLGALQSIRLLNAWGQFHFQQSDFATAQRCFEESAALSRFAYGPRPATADSVTRLARAYAAGGEPEKALAAADEAARILASSPSLRVSMHRSVRQLAQIYEELGRPAEAAQHSALVRKIEEQFSLDPKLSPPVGEYCLGPGPLSSLRKSNVAALIGHDPEQRQKAQEEREKPRKAQEALARDDLHLSKKLHLEVLEVRKHQYPSSEYPDGHPDLWASYAAIAEVMLDLDPVAGEAYCREALRMRPTPKWRQSMEYASTLIIWGRYLDRLHDGAAGEKAMLAALRIYEDHVPNGWAPYLSLCEHYLDHGDNAAAKRLRKMYMDAFPFVGLAVDNFAQKQVQAVWINSSGKRLPGRHLEANSQKHFKLRCGIVWILVNNEGSTVAATDIDADPTFLEPKGAAASTNAPPKQAIRFLNTWGRTSFNDGDFAAAQMCFAEAAGLGRFAFGNGRVVAESTIYLAGACLAAGDSGRALGAAMEASANLSGTPENGMLEFACDCRLADIYRHLGKPDEAAKHAARAEKARQRSRRIPGLEGVAKSIHPGTPHNLRGDIDIAALVGFDPERWVKVQEARKLLNREGMVAEAKSLSERGWGATYEGNWANAKKLFTAAHEVCEKAYPKSEFPNGHPHLADSLSDLASTVEGALSMQYCEQAMEMRLKLQGPKHVKYAESLIQLGLMLERTDPTRAELQYKEALQIQRDAKADIGGTLFRLGSFYQERSEYAKAAKIYLEAVERARRDPNFRVAPWPLNNLGNVYTNWGRFREAEPYLVEALKTRRQILHSNHPDLATSLNSLAALYRAKGQFEDALPLIQEAVAIWSNAPGGQNRDYQIETGLCALGITHRGLGNLAKAEECLSQALESYRKRGSDSKGMPSYLAIEIAELHSLRGEHAEAARLSRGAAHNSAVLLKRAAASQPEQGQMSNLAARRRYLDNSISFTLAAQKSPTDAYELLMAWKGIITDGQRLTRLARTASTKGNAETKSLFAKLEDVSRRYASQLNGPAHSGKAKQIAALESEREEIEIELTRQTDEFRVLQRTNKVSPADIRKALPSDAVLIDFLSYARLEKGKRTQSYVAFVVSNKGIDWVDLGPEAPIDAAIADFRMRLQRGQLSMRPEDPGMLLRDKLWQPIAQKIAGKKLVLLSPDRELCGLPFGALPSADGKRFLLEDVSLAVISMPQLIPEMMAAGTKALAGEPSLLALGDVDFNGTAGRPSQAPAKNDVVASIRGLTEGQSWNALPGTRGEVLAIESVFNKSVARGKCKLVRQMEATESLFCSEAPLHEYLHVATHGFFADASSEAAENRHPGLLSGIALAGANRPGTDGDDGILTALEVANLDLSKVKLAVLSACETGLGAATGGEGVVGLQRAFQIAGAKTTVTSLWKVDDEATRKLMERFYENQWKKKLGVLESLREAQLWMLNDGRTVLSESSLRGIARLNPIPERNTDPRLPPHLWAAFVVSGDWR